VNRSACSKCEIERLEQGAIAERLEQALDCTLLEHLWPHGLVSLTCDEDDRDFLLAAFQFPLEIGSAHAGHGDVEDQTSGLVNVAGREEPFC